VIVRRALEASFMYRWQRADSEAAPCDGVLYPICPGRDKRSSAASVVFYDGGRAVACRESSRNGERAIMLATHTEGETALRGAGPATQRSVFTGLARKGLSFTRHFM
jgi:hypothetical protein